MVIVCKGFESLAHLIHLLLTLAVSGLTKITRSLNSSPGLL